MQKKHPEINNLIGKKSTNKTIFSLAYWKDLDEAYAFYCARYENISWEQFMNLGLKEFYKKLQSVPENEPLYKIIQSRVINTNDIKDKDKRKYWQEMKEINAIPKIYITNKELDYELKQKVKKNKGAI